MNILTYNFKWKKGYTSFRGSDKSVMKSMIDAQGNKIN